MAIHGQSPGIKVGTAITLLTKSGGLPAATGKHRILYRDFDEAKAGERRQSLIDSLTATEIDAGYAAIEPELELGIAIQANGRKRRLG